MRRISLIVVALAIGCIVAVLVNVLRMGVAPAAPRPVVIRVATATSIADALTEAAPAFTRKFANITIDVVPGATGDLVDRIRRGERFDVFLGADPRWIAALQADGLVAPDAQRPVAGAALALAIPATSPVFLRQPQDILDPRLQRIAMGDPQRVPAGAYAMRVLEAAGLWDAVAPRTVLVDSAAASLDAALRNEVDAAFVFGSQLIPHIDGNVRLGMVWSLPETVYYAAPLRTTEHPATTAALVEFLSGDDFRNTLFHHGFQVE